MRIGLKFILLLSLSAVLFTACSKKDDGGGGDAADSGGCKYTDAVKVNTIPGGVLGYAVEPGDRDEQSAKVSWTGPSNKVILLRIKAGADGAEVFREIKGSLSVVLTGNDGLNLRGVRNSIDAYVYDGVNCITSKPETKTIELLNYRRTEPGLTTKVVTIKADNNGDGGTDPDQTDFAVGLALTYTDNSPQGTNNNYTITISTSPTVAGLGETSIVQNLAEPRADSILLPRAGSGANVVLYDARGVAEADAYNSDDTLAGGGVGPKVGNASETTYYFTGDPDTETNPLERVLYIHTQVQADTPALAEDGTTVVDTFYIGSPVRFTFGVTAAQVFINAVREFSIADDNTPEFSDFVFTALTPNYDSDLKDAVQLLQQSADAAVSYAVLQLKKAASGKLYVYSNEEGQMENTCGFLTTDKKFVDFSTITDEAAETAFELCEFTRQLNLQGNVIALSPSSLEDFVKENIKRGLTLSYVLSYDLAGTAADGGLITTKEVMDAIAAVDITPNIADDNGIGFGHRIFRGVAYAPYNTSATAANVLPTTATITAEYDTLKANAVDADGNPVAGDTTGDVRANAFSTFIVRANVVDTPTDATVDIVTDGRDGTSPATKDDFPLVGGVILTLDTSAPASYPVIDNTNVLAGAGDATTTLTGNLVTPFGADAKIGTFLADLASKNVLIIRDMVKPGGAPYSDLIYGTTAVASGLPGMRPSLEREYNANVRSYMLRDALDNSPLRNAIKDLGLDPNFVGAEVPLGTVTPHLYGPTSATYAISTDDTNLELRYTYPAYGALPADSTVNYAVTSVSRPTGGESNATTFNVAGDSIPTGDLGRYQLTTLTNLVPSSDPASPDPVATTILTADSPITTDTSTVGATAVAPASDTSSGCTSYILSDTITLPYTFADEAAATAFTTTLVDVTETDPDTGDTIVVGQKVASGVCLATPASFTDTTKTASLSDLEITPNVLNLVSTVVDVGGTKSLPTSDFGVVRQLLGPSGFRAVQNATLGENAQLQGIDVSWLLSPNTEMVSYTLTVQDSNGIVVYTSAGPALVKGAAEAKFTIPVGGGIVDQGFYTVTLVSRGKPADGAATDEVNFAVLSATVKLDVERAKTADIIAKLTAGEKSTNIGNKIVVIASDGFLGRPETVGNVPTATISAFKRARELGIGSIELDLSASSDTDPDKVGLFLAPQARMGEWYKENALYELVKREYKDGVSAYSCLEMNVEGKKYVYDENGTFSEAGPGKSFASSGNQVSGYSAEELRGCYVRTNQYGGRNFGTDGFTNFPGYGGQDGEKMIEVNDEFVKLLKEQNMVLSILNIRNIPGFVRGATPPVFSDDNGNVAASFGAVVKGDEGSPERTAYDLTLAKWEKLLLPFLENDYIEGLILGGTRYEAPSSSSTALPTNNARNQIRQYLDLRYVVNELAADTTNNFAFNPDFGVTIDTSLPLLQGETGARRLSGSVAGVMLFMQGFFAEWDSELNGGGFVRPKTPQFVLPDYRDNDPEVAFNDVKKIIAYAPEHDPKNNGVGGYSDPAVLDNYKTGNLALLEQRTLIGFNGTGQADNTFADVTAPDGVDVADARYPRVFDPSRYLYVPTEDGLQDVRKLAEILAPPVPNLRLRNNPMYAPSIDSPFEGIVGFNWHPTDIISGLDAASYGIDLRSSGTLLGSVYANATPYNYAKGAYVSNPGKWDDSLMFAASGYLRGTADTYVRGDNIMPLVVALSEFNGLANQEGAVVEPIITNAPLVSSVNRTSVTEVSFNIGEGGKLNLDSSKASDLAEFKAAYDDLYAKGAQYFVGYEITVVGKEQNPIFFATTDYTNSTAYSTTELPAGPFEFYVRAKYSVPFMDGSGSKDVYSFGVLKNAP